MANPIERVKKQTDSSKHVRMVENETGIAENQQLEGQFQESQNESNLPRRSERAPKPTEKMLSLQKEEAHKKERKFISMYNQWKVQARGARQQLKSDISDGQLTALVDNLEKARDDVTGVYEENRRHNALHPEIRRQVDACVSVTADITKIIYERISRVDGEFDSDREKGRLLTLLDCDHARSIYGSTISRVSHKSIIHSSHYSSHHSVTSCLASKCADAAADVAAKEAMYEVLLEENKQKEKIQHLEEQHKQAVEAQKRELERLQAEKDLKVAQARLGIYSQEAVYRTDNSFTAYEPRTDQDISQLPIQSSSNTVTAVPQTDMSSLAQALQDSIALNRLPVPEPFVFTGDPMQFVEWKNSFMSLIDQKSASFADKLYYLKRFVGGPARKTLDGTFYRNDAEAYQDAWSKLDRRYGQPFIIQRAFRERLANWPKVQHKDAVGLREFSDFLNACLDAMPHVKGLQILNDCEENQKLVQKLPDWAASRWNRQVTQTLNQSQDFPTFQEFAAFVSVEAEVACNPITSLYALRSSESASEKRTTKDVKRNKASVFSTQTNTDDDRVTRSHTKQTCMLCQDNKHRLHNCTAFIAKPLEERRKFVRENRLCYGCLKHGHSARDCRQRLLCRTCKRKHPTCLHDDAYEKTQKPAPPMASAQANNSEAVEAVALNVAGEEPSINTSMIVPVWVSSKTSPSSEKLVYALLDTQSDTTFIDQEVSDGLQADTHPVKLKLTTMIGKDTVLKSERVSGLRVRGYSSAVYIDLPPVYTKNCIPVNRTHIPTSNTAKHWKHLAAIVDEIPPLMDCEVGLLIGYNCSRALAPRKVIVGGSEEPYAVQTDLGWSIVGCSLPYLDMSESSSMCHRVAVRELPPVTPADAVRILELDFKDIDDACRKVSQEDILFLSKLKNSIKKNAQGHYEMPLPFKERPILPCNRQLATIRLNHLKRRLLRDELHKEHYVMSMNEVIKRGDAEEIRDDGIEGEKWYIPHHGVYHPKKPDKLRVVFDCSARYGGTSLNDHLLSGPDLINNLLGILIRFRQHPIALMCDIEKMFHQFHVDKSDRDYLRFLWWKNGELNAQPCEFRMKVHLFGATSSPGCANYGMKHLANENSDVYPLGASFVMKDFYVDDGITSTKSVEDAIKLAREARDLCAQGGLRLHKFVSNNEAVLESIPPTERANDVKELDLAFDDTSLERALGILWHTHSDCFKFKIKFKNQPATRRGILSTVASLYDPLGFVAPILLTGKRILQEMCRHGTGWDDPLKVELQPRWEHWKGDLNNLDKIDIPRSYAPVNFGKIIRTELHHFSDASISGYGQCSYLRLSNEDGEVHCALVIGKSRVAPTKLTTIPRLELTAAVVSVKVSNMLKEELGYANVQEFFWTDSKVVLGYINNEARRFHTFVANRVQRIHLSTTPKQWKYVPTTENPADHASRGLTVSELLSSNWFTGPRFLWEKDMHFPSDVILELPIGDPEIKVVHTLNTEAAEHLSLIDRLSNFSSWRRVTQAVARILRRINKDTSNSLTTVTERDNAP
ncbi:uncharacterized protein LOC143511529 [Brachyhypopomus gauderio]|uniref:uncharacterized protein LOC143511529 n=1 Tax=Brachyhypopomus gauderio TaxID=698409 RepID=UPI004041C091